MSKTHSPISVGVIGCGYWGPNYVRNLTRQSNCHLLAVCDQSEERLKHIQSIHPEVPCFSDYEEMLRQEGLDAVIVATPAHTHFEVAKAALLAGKHTLIEKPMASTPAECDELMAIAEMKGLTLMVGHTYLYSSPIFAMKAILDGGEIGDVLYINSQRLNLGLFQSHINVAWDLAPHDLSIILYLLGRGPASVNCQGNAHITPGIEDVTNISLKFEGGEFATIQNSWLEPRKVRQMTIVGTRGMIVYDDLEPLEKIRVYDTRVERPPHYDSFAQFHYSYHYGECRIPHLTQDEPLKVLCGHFIDCIITGGQPRSCGCQGAQLVEILEACSKSLAADGAPMPVSDRHCNWAKGHDIGFASESRGAAPRLVQTIS